MDRESKKLPSFIVGCTRLFIIFAILVGVLFSFGPEIRGGLGGFGNQKGTAIHILKQLAASTLSYAESHDGQLPAADGDGKNTWALAAATTSDTLWYNALLRRMQSKSAGDFERKRRSAAFYTKENILFLPGARYPENTRFTRPYFAIAMNRRLFRRGPDGIRRMVKLSEIQIPSRTVLFFEMGLPGEPKAHVAQSKGDYDGAPSGTAKSFVARYRGRGLLVFADGHVEEVSGTDLLTVTGDIQWSPKSIDDPSAVFWDPDPKVDPNRRVP